MITDRTRNKISFFLFTDGPEWVTMEPYSETLKLLEHSTLRSYNCTADCNPNCKMRWTHKDTAGKFTLLSTRGILRNGKLTAQVLVSLDAWQKGVHGFPQTIERNMMNFIWMCSVSDACKTCVCSHIGANDFRDLYFLIV